MPPIIHNPAHLTPQQRREIERRPFAPLSEAQRAIYSRFQDILESSSKDIRIRHESDEEFAAPQEGETRLDIDQLAQLHTDKYQLTWRDMGTMVMPKYLGRNNKIQGAYRIRPLDAYLRIVCEYVNQVRGEERNREAAAVSTANEDIEMGEGSKCDNEVDFWRRLGNDDSSKCDPRIDANGPSCAAIPGKQWFKASVYYNNSQIPSKRGAINADDNPLNLLRDIDCTGSRFQNLDYLFIPSRQQPTAHVEASHVSLLGIAPKQKFVFAIDSSSYIYERNHPMIKVLQKILLDQIPDQYFTWENRNPAEGHWRIYGQWPSRSRTRDDSPDSPQQHEDDLYNCGIFAVTNAFCLAFGFNLLCWAQYSSSKDEDRQGNRIYDLDDWKKPRMAIELSNGGFIGELAYDMLTIEEIKGQSHALQQAKAERREAEARKRKEELAAVGLEEEYEDEEGEEAGRGTKRGSSEMDNASDHEDTQKPKKGKSGKRKPSAPFTYFGSQDQGNSSEQAGFAPSPEPGSPVPHASDPHESDPETSTGCDDVPPSIKKRELYTLAALQYNLSLTPARYGPQPRDRVPFPSQFDAKIHQEAGLIYPAPNFFEIQKREYSREEISKVCTDFRLRNWEPWGNESKELFQKWVFSETGAVMARKRGDQVQPFPGIGITLDDDELW